MYHDFASIFVFLLLIYCNNHNVIVFILYIYCSNVIIFICISTTYNYVAVNIMFSYYALYVLSE